MCTILAGKRIETTLSILDFNGKSLNITNSNIYSMVRLSSQTASDYYPETMGNTFLVNAPMLFKGVWAMIKGFLDEKTRAKIKILGTDYLDTVLEYVDIDNLPKFLGGNCECEGGCLIAQPGPWNDYEIHGNGVRLKSQATVEEITD